MLGVCTCRRRVCRTGVCRGCAHARGVRAGVVRAGVCVPGMCQARLHVPPVRSHEPPKCLHHQEQAACPTLSPLPAGHPVLSCTRAQGDSGGLAGPEGQELPALTSQPLGVSVRASLQFTLRCDSLRRVRARQTAAHSPLCTWSYGDTAGASVYRANSRAPEAAAGPEPQEPQDSPLAGRTHGSALCLAPTSPAPSVGPDKCHPCPRCAPSPLFPAGCLSSG